MQDVGNMMNVTEDLNEINIAKDAVLSKDEERGAIVDKLAEELQSEFASSWCDEN